MTTASGLRGEVGRLLHLLQEAEITLFINQVVEKNLRKGVTRVTWGSSGNVPGERFRGEFATIEDYCRWLEAGAFSAVLYDGAILQISYDFDGNELVGHRLGYYPCPFDLDNELLQTEPILDVVSLYRGKDDSLIKLRSPLRFDYSTEAQGQNHPTVHLTILWPHCRWAVVAPLSPGHFVRFMFSHFYPHLWQVHEFIRAWPQMLGDRTITREEERLLHIECMRPEIAPEMAIGAGG